MITANSKQQYAVSIQTPSGPALIESVKQWEDLVELGRYNAILRSNRASDTNKVKISAVFKCGCDTCRSRVRGSDITLGVPA